MTRPHNPPVLGPGGSLRARLRHRLNSLGIEALVTVAGVSIGAVALATLVSVVVSTNWLNDAQVDRQRWADREQHIHEISEIAGDHFLAIVDSAMLGVDPEATQSKSDLATHLDMLAATATPITGDERFEELGASLESAAIVFSNAVMSARAAEPAMLFGPYGELARLEDAYSALQDELRIYSGEMRSAESESLADASRRAGNGTAVLVAVFAIAGLAFAIASAAGLRIRQREAALLERISDEKQLIQTVIDAMPESIVWKDPHSRVRGFNAALGRRLKRHGIQPELRSRLSDSAMEPDLAAYIDEVERVESQVMDSGVAVTDLQMTRPEPDGSSRNVLRTVIPLRRNGVIDGVLSTTRDITEVVNLERSLASAQRLESIGQLSAGVAHEINTPIQYVSDNTAFLETSFTDLTQAVSSLCEIAERHDPEAVAQIAKEADLEFLLEDIPDAVRQSREGLDQIASIVRAMKAFAHPGGEVVPTDINQLVATTVDVSRNEWKYHAEVVMDLDEDLPQPRCDEGQIKQVLLNMIINASDAIAETGSEAGTITITTRPADAGIVVEIRDTGAGMSPAVQQRIFERFYTTKPVGRGSGQGLAIAYDAITAHGGEIQVDSTPGEGTTFTITLPLTPPEDRRAL